MICAYNELYLSDAKRNLGECFDYAVNTCGMETDFFSRLFVQSGYADRFERGNPGIVSGMSGIELARKIINYAYPDKKCPEEEYKEGYSDVYWSGWVLAEYQWETRKRFKDIFSKIALTEVVSMYHVYHEMDIENFVGDMEKKYHAIKFETHLKQIRENMGITQAELSRRSGVSLRSIQMYEQRGNDINKAQAKTLYDLSRVLGCDIEDILEL